MASDIEFEPSPQLDALEDIAEGTSEWVIEFRTPYAGFIEFGAGPAHDPDPHAKFMPPKEAIEEWVQRKVPVTSTKDKMNEHGQLTRTVRKRRMKDDEAEEAAEAIRWHIYQHGIEPQPFARPAINDLRANLAKVVARAIKEGQEPGRAICEYIQERCAYYINANGTADQGNLAREIYISKVSE